MRRNIFFDGEPLPDDGDRYIQVPKGNDRMFAITLYNRRRGADRVRKGTATLWRMRALFEAIASRYPEATKSPRHKKPLVVRTRRAGPIIMVLEPLDGPVASVATKQ